MYKEKFVLSIVHDGYPVKETGSNYNRQVAIPFDSEYKILLKNKNDRKCTAKVFIDGRPVSKLGDFIINANGSLHLERFLDSSLEEGKKFKFVPLSDVNIDDPTSSKNGIIKVEFRLAKQENGICIKSDPLIPRRDPLRPKERNPWDYPDLLDVYYASPRFKYGSDVSIGSIKTYYTSSDSSMKKSISHDGSVVSNIPIAAMANVESGATVEGGRSNQRFSYDNLEVGSSCVTLKLKIVGIKDVDHKRYGYRFCSYCGSKIKKRGWYCSNCGRKL